MDRAHEEQMEAKSTLTSEERIWAAVAHAAGLIPLVAPLGPAIVWFMQRKRSAFSRFQALQAMAFQTVAFWVWMVVGPIIMGVVMIILLGVMTATYGSRSGGEDLVLLISLLVWGPMIAAFALYGLIVLIAAVASLTGRNFRYPLIGGWLARHVGYSSGDQASLSDEREDYAIASISHATCVLWLWGVATPVILWITQKDRSGFLRFQALQAAIYQALGALAYFALMAVYMISFFGMIAAGALGGTNGFSRQLSPGAGLFLLPSFCVGAAVLIAGPLYQLFGFIASIRTLRGHDYRYPLLGRILARRLEQRPPAEEVK